MKVLFHDCALEDYHYFKRFDVKIYNKINIIINAIKSNNYEGLGKPEPLKYDFKGFWSRRINKEHRLVYTVKDDVIYILKCRYHY